MSMILRLMLKRISYSNRVEHKAEQLVKENVRFSITNFNCILIYVSVSNDGGTFDASSKTTS